MNASARMLTPSELSEATGVGRETLRYYEEKGLVLPTGRTAAGYRRYDHEAIELIGFIKQTQHAGFTLHEIDELLQLRAKAMSTCGNVGAALTRKLSAMEEEIATLQRKHALVESMKSSCCPSPSFAKLCSFVPERAR